MGIFTYLKIGAAVVVLAICGYYVWNYHHMKTTIAGLEQQITELNLRAEVIEKAQKATDDFMKAKAKVGVRNVKERAEIDKVVETGDDPAMRDLFIQHGLLKPDSGTPKSRPPGNP